MDTDDKSRGKTETTALLDTLAASFEQIAAARKQAQEAGQPIPDDLRREIYTMREMLRENGLPEAEIDATPGLEPPD
ncbi:MAG: hypothetical protein JOZ49_00310 [Mycolicibacterium sp.]|jgi:hypothetical protein|nr:hypothetical protein [Mycolicibacterium sp.]